MTFIALSLVIQLDTEGTGTVKTFNIKRGIQRYTGALKSAFRHME
ncbi:hypothetical protein ACRWQN_09750 [Shewanella sp. HL-SH8]